MTGTVTSLRSVRRWRSPGPGFTEASTTRHTTSTSRMASRAVSTMRTFMRCVGLCTPGVSTNITCASAKFFTPAIRVRVVCGLSETMASFCPRMRLRSVDLPALGRPRKATKPDFMNLRFRHVRGDLTATRANLRDPSALNLEHLERQRVDLDRLSDVRHPSELGQQIPANCFEPLALDLDVQPIAHFVDADLSAEDKRAIPLVSDRFTLDVVFVTDLANDLLEQVLNGDEPGRSAVLIDDNGHLRLPALHLLEQLGYTLALRHEMRRPHQRRHRRLCVRRQRNEILHEHNPGDVVEVVAIDGHPRILLFAKQRTQILQRGVGTYGDDVRTRRHHFADDGLGEIDDRLQQFAAFSLGNGTLFRLGFTGALWRGDIRAIAAVGRLALATRRNEIDDQGSKRHEHSRDGVECRQQEIQHALRIAPHDEQRNQVLTLHDNRHHRDDEGDDRERVADIAETRDEHAGEDGTDPDQNTNRDEKLERIVEILTEAVVAASAFGHQPKRESHQRTEGSLDRSQEHRCATKEE